MKDVVMYTSNSCAYCKQAKAHLHSKGVPFVEKNVSKDTAARKELMEKGCYGVPVFLVGDELLQGYDVNKLNALLDVESTTIVRDEV